MRLYDRDRQRLYINREERAIFLEVVGNYPAPIRLFCQTLAYTGCRISEALALTPNSIQLGAGLVTFGTLKRRSPGMMREVPIPSALADDLKQLAPADAACLWQISEVPVNRSTAYRWVKTAMRDAGIHGAMACPKGLRHGYGMHAILSGVPLTMLQRWMGHASISTTTIYTSAIGKEEREIASWMWKETP